MIISILRLLLIPIEVFEVEFFYDRLVLVDKLVICNALSFFIFWNCCNCSIVLFFFVKSINDKKKKSKARRRPNTVHTMPLLGPPLAYTIR